MPNEIKVDTSTLKNIFNLDKALEREMAKALVKIGEKGVKTVQRNFDSYAANASGKTKESIKPTIVGKREVQIAASGNRAKVIQFIENGRGPGKMPPRQIIREWMDEVGISTGDDKVDSTISFLIARQIGRYGTKGHHIFERSQKEVNVNALKEVEAAVKRALKG